MKNSVTLISKRIRYHVSSAELKTWSGIQIFTVLFEFIPIFLFSANAVDVNYLLKILEVNSQNQASNHKYLKNEKRNRFL